ncbi:MAG: hypothetical protein LBP21_11640 [Synergistaceae bacterium]|jgi:hypothetical protein|nr:hypothetical protein [Synergistaceae bacterium]
MGSTAAVANIEIFGILIVLGMIGGIVLFSNRLWPKVDPLKKWIVETVVIILILLVNPLSLFRIVCLIDGNFASKYRNASGKFSVDVPWTWDINTEDVRRDSDFMGIPESAKTHLRAGFRISSRFFEDYGRARTVGYANMRVDSVGGPVSPSSPEELLADLSARLTERKELVSKTSDMLSKYAVAPLPDVVGDVRSTVENVRGRIWAKTARTVNAFDGRERTFVYYQIVSPANGALYIVTFSTDHGPQYLPIFRKVIRSFNFI